MKNAGIQETEKVVVMTGASGGIGRALLETWRNEDARLYLVGRHGAKTRRDLLAADRERAVPRAARARVESRRRRAYRPCAFPRRRHAPLLARRLPAIDERRAMRSLLQLGRRRSRSRGGKRSNLRDMQGGIIPLTATFYLV